MTRVLIFTLCLGALVLTIASLGCGTGTASGKTEMPSNVAAGKQLFEQNCVPCHGPKGDRLPIAPLNTKDFLATRGDATLITVLTEGKGAMPAWGKNRGGPFTDEQVQNVVAYLNFAAGRESSMVKATLGQQLYASNCVQCHGEKGNRIAVAPLDVKGFLDSRSDDDLVKAISEGRGQMSGLGKAKGGKLDDEQVKAIVAYLRSTVELNVAAAAGRGRQIYLDSCLNCHGERGDRMQGVALASLDFLSKLGDGKIVSQISDGAGAMPGFGRGRGGAYEPSDIGAILAYLKAWAGTSATSALTGSGPSGDAKDLYAKNCLPCHGDSGDKVANVQLRSKAYLAQVGDKVIAQVISEGNSKGMPAWGKTVGGPLTDEQINSVVAYLKSIAADTGPAPATSGQPSSGVADPQLMAKGKDLFSKNCVACHGDTRDKMPSAKLADKAWVTQQGADGLTQGIANGKGAMPAWSKAKGGQMSDDDIKALVAYLIDAVGAGSTSGSQAASSGSSGSADSGLVSKGKDIYSKSCAACHGDTRDRMPTAKLADKTWMQQKGADGLTQSIANGKGGMPAWSKAKGGSLSDDEIKAVVAFLFDAVGVATQ